MAGDGVEQHRRILDRAAERADLVERGRKRNQAVTGYRAIGRLKADHAAERRGLADRAAGVRAECERYFARRNNRRRAAGRAARNTGEAVRVVGRVHSGVLAGGTHRELVHIRLAGHDHVVRGELFHDRRVVRRLEVIEHLGRAGGQRALGADVVLDGNRNARERGQFFACGALFVHRLSLRERGLLCEGHIALHLVLDRAGAGEHVLRQLDCGDFLFGEQFGQLGRCFFIKCHISVLPFTRPRAARLHRPPESPVRWAQ